MLFDLRSRGRRTTVRGIYLTLAIVMGGGLILFGVGTGVGGGGLLNAFNGGGGGNPNQVANGPIRSAEKAVRTHPQSAAAWAQLVEARWTAAGQGTNFSTQTQNFTASGKKELSQAASAWQHYLQITNGRDPQGVALLAAKVYDAMNDYSGLAAAWEVETATNPHQVKGYECLAMSAYAAKETRKADLALAKVMTMVPKAQRKQLTTTIKSAQSQPTAVRAQGC
jgi:hypothetical protein